jgi:hypothetical protein
LRWIFLIAIALAGCYQPATENCRIRCGGAGACPSGMTCIDSWCMRPAHDATPAQCFAVDMASVVADASGVVADMASVAADLESLDDASGDCPILYVSDSTGNDANTGCVASLPKKTISAALNAVGTPPQEVHVCAGSYAETLIVDHILLGGYDCSTWTRTPDYGYPAFDQVNATVIQPARSAASKPAVVAKESAALIDGFMIVGPEEGAVTSVGLEVEGAATISNNNISGGSGTSTSQMGSVGIMVTAAADILHNRIDGGLGTTTATNNSFGAVGVWVTAGTGAPHIHENTIKGGFGSAPVTPRFGASAIVVYGPTALTVANHAAIEDNVIDGGIGSVNIFGDAIAAIDVEKKADVDIVHNEINAGQSMSGNPEGVLASNAGNVRILRNRIYGGSGFGTTAVLLQQNESVQIVDNMILTGAAAPGSTYGAWGVVIASDNVVVRHNTIIAGSNENGTTDIYLRGSPYAAVIEDNIFGASGSAAADVALAMDACAENGGIASWRHNVSFNNQIFTYAASCSGRRVDSIDALTTELTTRCTKTSSVRCAGFSGTQASGNLVIAGTCSVDSGCLASPICATTLGCLQSIFNGWDPHTNGRNDLDGTGWRLTTTTPCKITNGGLDFRQYPPSDVDLFGTPRTAPVSMGAHEYDGPCQAL